MASIEMEPLVYLPSEPIEPVEFYDLNNKHRQDIGKHTTVTDAQAATITGIISIEQRINQKSKAIERAVVEMINRFVDVIEVADVDEQGNRKFQLPPTEDGRAEQNLPIDKYDWITFGKVYNVTTYPTLDVHQIFCELYF
jgi:dynein heavy chain, axonemal